MCCVCLPLVEGESFLAQTGERETRKTRTSLSDVQLATPTSTSLNKNYLLDKLIGNCKIVN